MPQKEKPGLKIDSGLPEDIRNIILDKQLEVKKGCNCQISQKETIYKIIKEWKKLVSPEVES